MPNNRNRNRNRNRNKRNRNQSQNQNQQRQEEQEDTQAEAVPEATSSSIDDNGNSGSVSNGLAAGATSSENSNKVAADPQLEVRAEPPKEAAATEDEDKEKSTISAAQNETEAEQPPTEMGAKNSKQQSEKSGKRSRNETEQQVEQAPLKAPGSPRQAKVIVHRIVREVDEQQQQQPNTSQELKDEAVKVPEQREVVAAAPQPLQRSTKVIIHQVRVERDAPKGEPTFEEISTTTPAPPASLSLSTDGTGGTLSPPPRYLVESPKNVSGAGAVGHFGHFARDMQIQELELSSDCSSGEFNVLQSPLVCEVDSETEAAPPLDLQPSSRAEQQEQLRQRRAQKRNALESHFLPQLMNPRYLDSILEENSELAGAGMAHLHRSNSSGNDQAGVRLHPKLTETFPKSQLDFSRRHKRREEPVALMLETKLIEEASDLESCTRLQSALSPQSEDAELVYLSSSASSSMSDLMELELEQAAALAERALVDLDTDASKLFRRPDDEMSSTTTTDAATSSNETETEGEPETETDTERDTERDTESRESTPVNQGEALASAGSSLSSLLSAATPTPTSAEQPQPQPPRAEDTFVSFDSIREEPPVRGSIGSIGAASTLSATREEFVRNMDKVRELIEMTRREEEQQQQGEEQQQGEPQQSSIVADDEPKAAAESDPIKKLRLLCTETLASMPYGEQVLEELASVAQDIAEPGAQPQEAAAAATMPYPLPAMPHIRELQLSTSTSKHESKSSSSSSSSSSSTSAWLGMPTQADPKLLVCLSPAQRPLVGETKADQLLDDHQKFVERRGYHELSSAQVRALDNEQQEQQQQQQQKQSEMLKTAAMMRELRKSLTPTQEPAAQPPPVPVKSAETAAKASAKRDDASADPKRNGSSSSENKPRQAADPSEHTEKQQQQQQQTRSSHQMNSSTDARFPATTIGGMESELAKMFPSMAQQQQQRQGDIFEEQRKRFSNIETTSSSQPKVQQQQHTKRYSNIETSSYEAKKRTENGQVIYDITNSSHEKQSNLPAADSSDHAPPPPIPPPPIMSATKLNGSTTANTFIEDDDATKNSRERANGESKSGGGGTYEEFRQRAKAAVDAIGAPRVPPTNGLDNEKVFKDFDRLSQQMNAELQSTRERREKSASLFDLSGMTRSQGQGKHPLEELKQRRHAHMQELEREIERSSRSRQERMSSVPRSLESTGHTPRTHEIPIELEQLEQQEQRSRRAESMCNLSEPRPRPHTSAGHYNYNTNASQDDWSRYASDLGYSENIARPFAREVEICYQRQNPRQSQPIRAPRLSASTNDLSSGHHQQQQQQQHSFDSFNAYGGRRTHAPMLSQAPQQQRPHYASCYSMIERDPNPKYISTTSRRGVSPGPAPQAAPASVLPPPAYDRQQRRSSLPRELHEQQLKYILSKEEELRLEVERLQLERRRLMEEMQRAPVLPPPQRRESYRPAAKLPTLSEDEVFRQQMAEEWMNKVAEREERRQHKIIKISKIEDEQDHATERSNISDEFLSAVKERRHKLAMPADSDWESGAESQPQAQAGVAASNESDAEAAPVRILEGQAEASLRQLPRHLREFAKFSTSEQLPDGAQVERHEEQERREEATDNTHSSASHKTSIVKTYKVSRLPPSVQDRGATATATAAETAPAMSVRLRPRPPKQTRFLLNPQQLQRQRQRRSWSESDLLKEIDSELQLAKGFLYANVYKVKHEYMSEPESDHDRPRKMAQLGRRQYDGIGPVTNDGMPIILRSEVQEPHQHEWYKRLYQTIHKQKNGARPSYKSNGYVSEPEPNYDSDYSTVRYRTQNPHRVQSVSSAVNVRNLSQDEKLYGTMPNPIKSAQNSYKNQPGRIEDYTTGHSSVSEKEKKENLEQSKLSPLYTEGNLSRALAKESGYTSDSNLVFRKKELPVSSPLSPVEQRQAYKSLQAGGEPPLFGFRKPAPERPRDVNIHFKTPIRHEQKQYIPEEELATRQAEHMQKLYHEERRRKYLQELQDMNSRRHTDNFTPSQKSPIALNRYDDFPTDVTLKSLVGPKTVARALYNFQGQSSKELSFRKGDTIYIRRQIDPNWYEGEHNAMIGLLPASYVEIVSRDGARTPSKRPSEGQARAKYNFQAQSGVELSLNKGELVTLTRRVDGNWFEGKIANRKGIFPVSYVEVLTDIGAEDIAARTTTVISSQSTTNLRPNLDVLRTNINNEFNTLTQNGAQPVNGILKETRTLHKTDALHVDTSSEPLAYRALYKYRPQNSDELELLEGDLVHVLEKCDDGWFVGTSQRTGCFGTFPGNYVERA